MEFLDGQMELNMKDNGQTANLMVEEYMSGQMAEDIKDNI